MCGRLSILVSLSLMTWPLWRPVLGQDGVGERIVLAIGYNFDVRLSNFHRDLKVYVGVAVDVICLQWQALVFKGAFQVTKVSLGHGVIAR